MKYYGERNLHRQISTWSPQIKSMRAILWWLNHRLRVKKPLTVLGLMGFPSMGGQRSLIFFLRFGQAVSAQATNVTTPSVSSAVCPGGTGTSGTTSDALFLSVGLLDLLSFSGFRNRPLPTDRGLCLSQHIVSWSSLVISTLQMGPQTPNGFDKHIPLESYNYLCIDIKLNMCGRETSYLPCHTVNKEVACLASNWKLHQ